MAQLQCVVVTPEETAIEEEAAFVVVPLFDGELGIAAGHSPLIGRLGFGELRFTGTSGQTSRHYIDGGFVQVADNVVTVLTGRTMPAGELNLEHAREQLAEAMRKPAHTDELLEIRDRSVRQARAQIQIGNR